ncbi:hypothetical protein YC2023_052246 [Brassica napus]
MEMEDGSRPAYPHDTLYYSMRELGLTSHYNQTEPSPHTRPTRSYDTFNTPLPDHDARFYIPPLAVGTHSYHQWVAPTRLLPHILVDWPHLLWTCTWTQSLDATVIGVTHSTHHTQVSLTISITIRVYSTREQDGFKTLHLNLDLDLETRIREARDLVTTTTRLLPHHHHTAPARGRERRRERRHRRERGRRLGFSASGNSLQSLA